MFYKVILAGLFSMSVSVTVFAERIQKKAFVSFDREKDAHKKYFDTLHRGMVSGETFL